MSLTFYYSPMSTATMTDIAIEELGIPCKRVRLDIRNGESKSPEFLKINPNGKVPTIVHDDTAIWESSAICMYLGETFGVEKKLYPAPGPKRGEAMKWIAWTNVTLGDAVYNWARNTLEWAPKDHQNSKAAEAAKGDIANCLGILNEALAGKSYLVGDYTLADAHLNSYIDWLRHMKIDISSYVNIEAWSKRCCARPAYKKVMSAEN